ncbi:MAG: type II toxin-antitoxin system RelB/DinJ family antitoxin [Coriobacteriales bacterium]|jgi:addiction module RelB/DinJ family antitoxin|nr:type II toxin-antitoxin system RelB/DinJ family antitoxin [Coriobacteriales bacterium]
MTMITVSVRLDEEVKKGAEEVFKDLGLSTAAAINVFFRQVKRKNAIPFQLTRDDFPQKKVSRKSGGLKGEIWIADDFDAPLTEFEDYL